MTAVSESGAQRESEEAMTSSVLIFDLEAVECTTNLKGCDRSSELVRLLQVLASLQTHFEAKLLQDVRAFKAKLLREEGSVDTVVLATHLAAVGYKVAIRTALGGGIGQECFHNLHYEFLLVTDEHNFVEYIVDSRFREQFHISQSTEGYRMLLEMVPEEYVGTAARLVPMVKLLCGQMQEAFQVTGLTCPPWRRADSMISKWVPSKVRDTEVASPSSSPEGRYGKSLVGMSPRGPLSRCNSGVTTSSTLSSTRTSFTRRSSMPAVPAKPLVRQAGFKPCAPFGAVREKGRSSEAAEAGTERRCRSLNLPRSAYKENTRAAVLAGGNANFGKASQQTALRQDSEELNWQAPRIRTVKMSGDRQR